VYDIKCKCILFSLLRVFRDGNAFLKTTDNILRAIKEFTCVHKFFWAIKYAIKYSEKSYNIEHEKTINSWNISRPVKDKISMVHHLTESCLQKIQNQKSTE